MLDLERGLEKVSSDITWNFVGILDTAKKLHPIPKNIQIQALFEYLAKKRIVKLARKLRCRLTEATSTREYPDITLEGKAIGNKKVAIDIKTTRRTGADTISGFTLGSYGGYFRHPNVKKPGCRIPYGQFDEHWIVGFIYTWNENADTLHMVSDIELVVKPKWKIASKSTGTGTTTAIGSIKKISDLKAGAGGFRSEKEFLSYWRSYGRK